MKVLKIKKCAVCPFLKYETTNIPSTLDGLGDDFIIRKPFCFAFMYEKIDPVYGPHRPTLDNLSIIPTWCPLEDFDV
jgi:hypothetical protein